MSSDVEIELYKVMQEMRQKYTYFLLAAAAACVGFSVTQSKDAQLSVDMAPLALAVAFWGISFCYGCRYLSLRSSSIGANIEILRLRGGRHPAAGRDVKMIAAGLEVIETDFDLTNNKVSFAYRWQFRWFVIAGAAFLAWHVWQMWLRT